MTALPANPRAQRTYRALVDAGLELLAERPIDALAIDEIVGRAGVAKGSFFNHFADKPALARRSGRKSGSNWKHGSAPPMPEWPIR